MLNTFLRLSILLFILDLSAMAPALAQEQPQITAEQFLASLKFQGGKITLPDGIAVLDLPENFQYLGPEDAGRLITQGWGNPPGMKTLGLILPADVNPLGGRGWGVVLTYQNDGHVNDSDADSIDYTELLKKMQAAFTEQNEQRKQQGYGTLDFVGWAENPTYDKATHKLYWAKELAAENAPDHTLNYDIRVLGRQGVLVLTAVSGLSQIDTIKARMPQVVNFTNFTPGNAYNDFNDSTDKTAAYGLAALIAGGAAAKMGLFAKLLAMAVAFKKVIVLVVAGFAVSVKKWFGRGKKPAPSAVNLTKNNDES